MPFAFAIPVAFALNDDTFHKTHFYVFYMFLSIVMGISALPVLARYPFYQLYNQKTWQLTLPLLLQNYLRVQFLGKPSRCVHNVSHNLCMHPHWLNQTEKCLPTFVPPPPLGRLGRLAHLGFDHCLGWNSGIHQPPLDCALCRRNCSTHHLPSSFTYRYAPIQPPPLPPHHHSPFP